LSKSFCDGNELKAKQATEYLRGMKTKMWLKAIAAHSGKIIFGATHHLIDRISENNNTTHISTRIIHIGGRRWQQCRSPCVCSTSTSDQRRLLCDKRGGTDSLRFKQRCNQC
jgi:hypothetical protein